MLWKFLLICSMVILVVWQVNGTQLQDSEDEDLQHYYGMLDELEESESKILDTGIPPGVDKKGAFIPGTGASAPPKGQAGNKPHLN